METPSCAGDLAVDFGTDLGNLILITCHDCDQIRIRDSNVPGPRHICMMKPPSPHVALCVVLADSGLYTVLRD